MRRVHTPSPSLGISLLPAGRSEGLLLTADLLPCWGPSSQTRPCICAMVCIPCRRLRSVLGTFPRTGSRLQTPHALPVHGSSSCPLSAILGHSRPVPLSGHGSPPGSHCVRVVFGGSLHGSVGLPARVSAASRRAGGLESTCSRSAHGDVLSPPRESQTSPWVWEAESFPADPLWVPQRNRSLQLQPHRTDFLEEKPREARRLLALRAAGWACVSATETGHVAPPHQSSGTSPCQGETAF